MPPFMGYLSRNCKNQGIGSHLVILGIEFAGNSFVLYNGMFNGGALLISCVIIIKELLRILAR